MRKKYVYQILQEFFFFGFRLLPLFYFYTNRMQNILVFILISDAIYYFSHRCYHSLSWRICVPFHHYHHKKPETLSGVISSDTVTMLIWLGPLCFMLDLSYYVLLYLVVFQTIAHYLSHQFESHMINKPYFNLLHHMQHHHNPHVNYSPIYWDMLMGTFHLNE